MQTAQGVEGRGPPWSKLLFGPLDRSSQRRSCHRTTMQSELRFRSDLSMDIPPHNLSFQRSYILMTALWSQCGRPERLIKPWRDNSFATALAENPLRRMRSTTLRQIRSSALLGTSFPSLNRHRGDQPDSRFCWRVQQLEHEQKNRML